MTEHHHNPDEKPGWADTKGFRNAFLGVLIVSCVLAVVAGFVPAFQNPHPHFPQEHWGVFFAVWGFAAFMFIVLAGQHLRKLVGRKEDYYEERE
ncbi:hypothetical protein PUV54_03350 [Hyphococcus flavus]|uniref:Uncharacterized protein n=1 Tax=Hyphococcus flavus TaxID=1866326 RepID=A0AAE9ZC96_9PROT|nr:hypothetical protein [Hyphococcus flavus]WDI32228.1 hypothetical protein PUV54_03350 [Hyphococcus flavus]